MTADPRGIVRWTISAFHTNPNAGDDELVEILEAAGLPHAQRAVMMLPIAYGRRILEGLVELPPTYRDGDRELVLADDPIFAAADRIAREEATRADLDRIGLHSSEVNAVNAALHAGSKAEDLVLSPPAMTLRDRDVTANEPQAILDELVRAHGSTLPLLARVFPGHVAKGRVQLQLDVVATIGERSIIESFGGIGTTVDEALGDTIKKFVGGSLHVLLAMLDRRELGGDQVSWETWGEFEVCLGGVVHMWASVGPRDLREYTDALKAALLAANPSPDVHWARTYFATNGTEMLGFDMLLDNDAFEPGVTLVRDWKWPVTEQYYARRHFLMLRSTHRPRPS